MKKILFVLPALLLAAMIGMTTVSCFAPSYKDGDTVAASEFEPADTSLLAKKKLADSTRVAVTDHVLDSVGMYYVGSGSTKQFLQLVSYPSKRDTFVYGKTRHIKVKGSADFNNVVRVKFYLLNGKDSLVSTVEQVVEP